MQWQPLSRRIAGAEPDGPYEGAPDHLKHPILSWIRERLRLSGFGDGDERVLREVGVRFRMTVPLRADMATFGYQLINAADDDDEFLFDLVDALLDILGPELNWWETLDRTLGSGASVWRVDDDQTSLVRIVSDEAQATYEAATSVTDEATTELAEAWANAFGRNGDPSDAWDHAIKAVEDVLIPEMMPNNRSATLGNVLGELSGQNGAQWKLVLPGNNQNHDVAHLVAMLRLMWPNHDRHGGATPKRTPSEQEARAVVTLAATIVQWHREGWIIQKR